jgi:hypothetical protein
MGGRRRRWAPIHDQVVELGAALHHRETRIGVTVRTMHSVADFTSGRIAASF